MQADRRDRRGAVHPDTARSKAVLDRRARSHGKAYGADIIVREVRSTGEELCRGPAGRADARTTIDASSPNNRPHDIRHPSDGAGRRTGGNRRHRAERCGRGDEPSIKLIAKHSVVRRTHDRGGPKERGITAPARVGAKEARDPRGQRRRGRARRPGHRRRRTLWRGTRPWYDSRSSGGRRRHPGARRWRHRHRKAGWPPRSRWRGRAGRARCGITTEKPRPHHTPSKGCSARLTRHNTLAGRTGKPSGNGVGMDRAGSPTTVGCSPLAAALQSMIKRARLRHIDGLTPSIRRASVGTYWSGRASA